LRQRLILGGVKEMLRLRLSDMLATCAYVYLTAEGGFVHLRGDGVIAFVYEDGGIVLRRYDWPDNRPFYPAYVENNLSLFVQAHGGDINALVLKEEVYGNRSESKKLLLEASKNHSIADGIRGITVPIAKDDMEKQGLLFVAVFSDGVCQVEDMAWTEAARQLLAFKNYEGVFAKRRMMRFVQDTHKTGKGPLDDIACAVVRVDRSDEPKEALEKIDGS